MLIKVEKTDYRLPGSRDPTKWTAPFTFVLIADPQLGLFKNNNSWEEELEQVRECIAAAAAAQPQPAFIFVLGDLVHAPVPALNTTGPNAEAIRAVRDEQARDLAEALDKYSKDIPVLVIPGNHDVGQRPTAAAIEDYQQLWGKPNFSFWFGGVKFVAANSSLFYDDSAAPEAAEEHFAWIEEELKDGAEKGAQHIFLLQHHQFYWRQWGEEDDPTTKLEIRQMKTHNFISTFQLPQRWRLRFLPLLKKYNVKASFHGHLHSDFAAKEEKIQQIVVTSCGFATNDGRPGWRVVEVNADGFEHKLVPVEWRTKEYPFLSPRFA